MGTFIYALVVLIFLCHDITADEECVITVKQGILRGEKRISAYNKTYCAFFGIPYGKPPVGESRFKLAEQADDWNGIYDATKEKPSCPQIAIVTHEYTGEEDCLYLNVYTNQLRNGNGERKATLVSIHGGAFLSGSASINKYGPDFFLNDDVILVTIQYRLGILGFLALPDVGIPGNNGLKDQSLALRWVHENIEYFGGDANNVTLIGESAGAASAHYHLLSNMSKDFFQRIIIQSGSALSSWAFKPQEELKKSAVGTANTCGCNDTSTSEGILRCLKTETTGFLVPIGLIGGYYPTAEEESVNGDEPFISESPHELCPSGKFQDKAVLLGTNIHEAAMFIALIPLNEEDPFESIWRSKAAPYIQQNHLNEQQLKQCVKESYFNNDTDIEDSSDQLYTDLTFLIEQDATAKICAKHMIKPVYYYYFQYDGLLALTKILKFRIKKGPTHADENGYLFHQLNTPPVGDSGDWIMSRRLVKLWTTFAKHGIPFLRVDPDGVDVDWTPFTLDNQVYLDINRTFTMKKDLRKERLDIWERCKK